MNDITKFADYMHDVKNKVRHLMEEDINCRNNDNYLVLKYWFIELQTDTVSIKDAFNLTKYKDIYNARGDIQHKEGILLPTIPEIIAKRIRKEEIVRAYYGEDSEIYQNYQLVRYGVK